MQFVCFRSFPASPSPPLLSISSGPPIIQVPEESAIIAPTKEELIGALMVPAHSILQELVAHAAEVQRKGQDSGQATASSEGQVRIEEG